MVCSPDTLQTCLAKSLEIMELVLRELVSPGADFREPIATANQPTACYSMTTGRLATLLRGLGLMTPQEQKRSVGILVLMMAAGFLESAIVALVIPIVYVAVDPQKLETTKIGHLIELVVGSADPKRFFVYLAGILVVLLIVSSAVSALTRYLSELQGTHCVKRLGSQVLRLCISAPYSWILSQESTRISNYVLEDVRMWRRDFLAPLFIVAQSGIMIIAPIAVVLSLAPVSGLIAVATTALVIAIVILALRRKIYREASRFRESQYHVVKTIRQIVGGLREIKVSDSGEYFLKTLDRYQDTYSRTTASLRAWNEAPTMIVMMLGQIGFLAAGIVLFLSNTSRAEIAGQLALIGFVVTRVLPAFNRLAIQIPIITRSVPYVQSIFRLFDEFDRLMPLEKPAEAKPVADNWRKLRLDNVTFKYDNANRPSLENANIELNRSEFYGFVGRSGAGKTTLANLLLGLIDPTVGTVSIDGISLRELSRSAWQRRFGYVPQDPFILDASVRENITFGMKAEDAALWRVLANVGMADIVEKLESGLDTMVGERGRQLSGGQVQRLAIARALIRQPEILFLDEATSALDNVTESGLLTSLYELKGTTMIIMITHRVSSLRGCDKAFVLHDGHVVGAGSYKELMKSSKRFQDLIASDKPALVGA